MSATTVMIMLSLFFFITGYLGIWAIREGGSFAFMAPSRWWRKLATLTVRKAGRNRPAGPPASP